MRHHTIVAIVVLLSSATVAAQPARQGHPMIPPYPGSTEGQSVNVVAFEEYNIPTGPTKDGKFTKTERVEGKLTNFGYSLPSGRSTLEVFRNYEGALEAAGFQTLFTCRGEACGGQVGHAPMGFIPSGDSGYLAAKLARAEGDVYVAMNVMPTEARFVIVETKPMATGLVKISADALNKDILSAGHAAVYDILFDTGRATIKPESTPAVAEIARLLSQNPKLALHVVGHTDNVGALAQNLDLSKRRAEAVVTVLTTSHKIAAARLRADGVGPLAPVATNDTDAGRAKNRRVELVKQ
jgi:outer membrane protein OmpA-like peptidoglycan-associated protein